MVSSAQRAAAEQAANVFLLRRELCTNFSNQCRVQRGKSRFCCLTPLSSTAFSALLWCRRQTADLAHRPVRFGGRKLTATTGFTAGAVQLFFASLWGGRFGDGGDNFRLRIRFQHLNGIEHHHAADFSSGSRPPADKVVIYRRRTREYAPQLGYRCQRRR